MLKVLLVALLFAFPAAAQDQFQFKCPQPGTVITFSDKSVVTFTRSDGLSCFYKVADGPERGWFASAYSATNLFAVANRETISRLWPAKIGDRVSFHTLNGTTGWNNEIIIREKTKLTIAAGTFDVLVIDVIEEGNRGNIHKSVRRFYYAPDLGFHVKFEPILERGQWGSGTPTPLEAVKVTLP